MRRWLEEVSHEWHAQAACASRDPDVWKLFEPLGDKEPITWGYGRAETAIDEFCLNCPVMQLCAAERDRHEYLGVWGGEFSEKRGIVSIETGLLIRKWASAQTVDESTEPDEIAPDPEPVFEWEADVFLTPRGVEQFGLPLAMAT